ncbi:hypothetical protein G6F40_015368 [Rhizopus arrhizus]|nr:hypothetical protein G6F40_015368 [Rhizopus arrhizus]
MPTATARSTSAVSARRASHSARVASTSDPVPVFCVYKCLPARHTMTGRGPAAHPTDPQGVFDASCSLACRHPPAHPRPRLWPGRLPAADPDRPRRSACHAGAGRHGQGRLPHHLPARPQGQRCGALGRRQGQRQPHPGGLRRQDGAGAGLQGLPGARLRRQQGRLPEGQGAVPAHRRGEDLQPFPGRCT